MRKDSIVIVIVIVIVIAIVIVEKGEEFFVGQRVRVGTRGRSSVKAPSVVCDSVTSVKFIFPSKQLNYWH